MPAQVPTQGLTGTLLGCGCCCFSRTPQTTKVCNGPGVTDLLSTAAWMGLAVNLGHLWLGAYSDMSLSPFGVWSWVDGTNASNVNCGSVGCGPYRLGEPK
jgi:hypothetical protein